MKKKIILKYTDLIVWQKGHRLVLEIYQTTRYFPSEEKYGLTQQMRRCAVSITSNIAEGFGRYYKKEKIRFYYIALGSTIELQNQLLVARDIKYLDIQKYDLLTRLSIEVNKLLNSLIKNTK